MRRLQVTAWIQIDSAQALRCQVPVTRSQPGRQHSLGCPRAPGSELTAARSPPRDPLTRACVHTLLAQVGAGGRPWRLRPRKERRCPGLALPSPLPVFLPTKPPEAGPQPPRRPPPPRLHSLWYRSSLGTSDRIRGNDDYKSVGPYHPGLWMSNPKPWPRFCMWLGCH